MDQEVEHHGGPTLTIDLGAICRNYRRLAKLAPTAEVAAVIKADAYGLGAQEIAPNLARSGCKIFFVALLNEAITLRRILPTQEIAVLAGPNTACLTKFRDHRLTPVLNSLAQLAAWQSLGSGTLPAILHI
ncbi:MAG: alanine racemase, partial [Alphaproteobacteria bacterium]